MTATESTSDLGFDPDALRNRYRIERDKRLRVDGNNQYLDIGGFQRFTIDPYADPNVTRDPINDEMDAIVIGGGFGGLLAAARLREAGVQSIRVIDKAGDFGGTWYWNRYPGAQCDIESYIYMPLLEEMGYMPTEKYARAPEILEYSRSIGRKYDLYRDACFQTEVKDLRWEESSLRWVITTDRGDEMRARYVAMSNGPLDRPKLPGVEGIETFKGHTFHTSRWDYAYTNGDSYGGLTGLKGKRVAVIGTGATAVQCVPHVGEMADHLYVFQRTPSSVDFRRNSPTDPNWWQNLEPGWQQRRMDNFNIIVSGGHQDEDLVNDGWTDIMTKLSVTSPAARKRAEALGMEAVAQMMELADFAKMEQVRSRVDEEVLDDEIRDALKPFYRQFCKRPTFNDDYLATFNRPNVTLVDTQGRGVDRVTERGVVFEGKEYEVDCIIFATGFEVGTAFTRRTGYNIVGRNGVKLDEKWANGLQTFHGLFSRGFPNCFFLGITQTGLTANFTHMLNEQTAHMRYIVQQGLAAEARTIEASEEAEQQWVKTIQDLAIQNQQFQIECTPGYYNNEGQPGNKLSLTEGRFGPGPVEFFKLLKTWREEGNLAGIELG